MQYIAFDSHKKYTLASVEKQSGGQPHETRIAHERGALRRFLEGCDKGSPVALETIGNWYWIVDEIEEAGFVPQLVNARKAKLLMGSYDKTDKLDARGLNRLQRNGTLPTVWIPPKELRDVRDLPRTRMVLVQQRTRLKNRIHATLDKYGLKVEGVSDIYGRRGRPILEDRVQSLPPQTRFTTERLLEQLDSLNHPILQIEKRMIEVLQPTKQTLLLQTLPGVGPILSFVIGPEMGDVDRFPGPDRYASYSGTTPRVRSSGGKTRYGRLRPDVNRYLKWAYIEAANVVARQRENWQDRHVVNLYLRIRQRKGHAKAVGAVARHLAEATYWMLKKEEPYRDPRSRRVSSTKR